MGFWEAIVIITAIIAVTAVLKTLWGPRHRAGGDHGSGEIENRQLRGEVRQLQERVQVLERIATDRESGLEREIERLRDR